VIVLGIETSTPHTSVAIGTEQGIVASSLLGSQTHGHEVAIRSIEHLHTNDDEVHGARHAGSAIRVSIGGSSLAGSGAYTPAPAGDAGAAQLSPDRP
jgi:hypothetical protein